VCGACSVADNCINKKNHQVGDVTALSVMDTSGVKYLFSKVNM
jgi:hypothetical protein